VLVLIGAGKGFCPGADIGQVASSAPDDPLTADDFRVPILPHNMPAVTIAAVNGAYAGAGLVWALACDFRFAAESARFNVAFLDVGVAGDMDGPWSLSRIVGSARARELYFLPGKFDAAEALRIGHPRFPDDRFQEEVDAIVHRLTDCAPIALRTLKANFVDSERMDFAGMLRLKPNATSECSKPKTLTRHLPPRHKAQAPIQRPLTGEFSHVAQTSTNRARRAPTRPSCPRHARCIWS
jgi:2-(1,2-epoxy-1,2-dihydrophenyl)acetyl-CoA isomerase